MPGSLVSSVPPLPFRSQLLERQASRWRLEELKPISRDEQSIRRVWHAYRRASLQAFEVVLEFGFTTESLLGGSAESNEIDI